jgi:hypothetical protein
MKATYYCLFVTIGTVPLLAQQSRLQDSTTGAHIAKQTTQLQVQKIERRCRALLEPLGVTAQLAENTAYLEGRSPEELSALEMNLRECVTDAFDRHMRQQAFEAHQLVRDEQDLRVLVDTTMEAQEANKARETELKKEHDNFLDAAKFAAAIYKENEQRKHEELNLLAFIGAESRRYRDLYNLAEEILGWSKTLIDRPPAVSLPVFVAVPTPQVIRVESPSVPEALHCTSNTTDLALGGSMTWTNCW